MKFYEYDCEVCGVHIWSPVTEEQHKKKCSGVFMGLLLLSNLDPTDAAGEP